MLAMHNYTPNCSNNYKLRSMSTEGPQVTDTVYAVEPMEPADNFLEVDPQPSIPLGAVKNLPFPFIDYAHFDDQVYSGVTNWMSGWSMKGESGLISRNDNLFRIIYRQSGLTYSMRDCHDNSTLASTRADVTMGFSGCALLIAEEKDESRIEDAVADLQRKFQWIPQFHELPFIFGIAINRFRFEVYALERRGMRVLLSADLSDLAQRWRCVVAAINIARVLRYFISNSMFYPIPSDINDWSYRGRGKYLRIGMKLVEVRFTDETVFQKLSAFYTLTSQQNVPHLERLCTTGPEQAIVPDKGTFRLTPVGLCRRPRNPEELRTALQQIVDCVLSLHSLGYCHCDIRWSNIVWTEEGWFLIDCTFAVSLEDKTYLQLLPTVIKPEYVFDKNTPWSQRHDLFQVGILLMEASCELSLPAPLLELRNYLCDRRNVNVDVRRIKAALQDDSVGIEHKEN
jgi:hypothetical protein